MHNILNIFNKAIWSVTLELLLTRDECTETETTYLMTRYYESMKGLIGSVWDIKVGGECLEHREECWVLVGCQTEIRRGGLIKR